MDMLKNTIKNLIPDDLVMIDYNDFSQVGKFKIIIDSSKGIDLNTTSLLAKKIKKSNVINDRFPNGIELEISSPGIDANLIHPVQYKKNIGRTLKIKTSDNLEIKEVKLSATDDNGIKGILQNGQKINLKYSQIENAKVIIKF